jgi:hypothetical protein
MNVKPWDSSGTARNALNGIVKDPHYGAGALSQPAVMSNLLKDLLPDEPREAGLLVAAAQADLAGALRGYLAQGLDPATAISLTTGSFVTSTSHTPEACSWVVNELAVALGLNLAAKTAEPVAAPPPEPPPPTVLAAAGPGLGQAVPPQTSPPQAPPFQSPALQSPPLQTPSPYAPPPWGIPPKPQRPGRANAVAAALVGFAGAVLVLIGCLVPYERFPGSPGFGILTGHRYLPVSFTFWFASEPIGVMLIVIALGVALLASQGSGLMRGLLPGMLLAFGTQTTLLFAGVAFTVIPVSDRKAGGFIGLLGGLVLLAAGVIALMGAISQQAGAPSAQVATTVGQGTAGR